MNTGVRIQTSSLFALAVTIVSSEHHREANLVPARSTVNGTKWPVVHQPADIMLRMNGGVRERVEALRQEIGEIQKLNLAYLQTPRPDFTAMEAHTRREQRLKDIMKELKSMTAWKKP
jgi:hypothetical protein